MKVYDKYFFYTYSLQYLLTMRKMEIQKTVLVLSVLINFSNCDNTINFNTKYNMLISKSNYNLGSKINTQLPKESKFFDLNDFDSKYLYILIYFMFIHWSYIS